MVRTHMLGLVVRTNLLIRCQDETRLTKVLARGLPNVEAFIRSRLGAGHAASAAPGPPPAAPAALHVNGDVAMAAA